MIWRHLGLGTFLLLVSGTLAAAQAAQPAAPSPTPRLRPPIRADILRGAYGQYRANNDLLSYHLDIRVDPEKKFISGRNTVRFRMLQGDSRIQLDLYANLDVERILFGGTALTYQREVNAVFIDFPEPLRKGREYAIDIYYSGTPREVGRFGGIAFRKDPTGRHWINTACEGEGSSIANGYLERDWTGVGVSPKFDFIIIHESAHEWFGNAVSAADVSDMWIQEGWTTYLEAVYVEKMFGAEDALKYINAYKSKVGNRQPVITQRGIHRTPSQDMYFKGALFLHTLRGVVNDEVRWWKLLRDTYQQFKYRNILTEEMVRFISAELRQDLTPMFDQYLRRAELPVLELAFDETAGTVAYRWRADERGFAMPIRVGDPRSWQTIRPTTDWQLMKSPLGKDRFDVAADLYYVNVLKQ